MELTINELAKLSGISTRTLRYYDELDLLKPAKLSNVGYRIYGQVQIDMLQQILFYRELGLKLEAIKEIVTSSEFDFKRALLNHREELLLKREKLNVLIETVNKTLESIEEEFPMENHEKFEGLKKQIIEENDLKYGEEIREKYGDDNVMASYMKIKGMTDEQYQAAQGLEKQLFERLKEAIIVGDYTSEVAQEAAELHKRWICFYWPKYTKEAHAGLAQMYVADERFTGYYDERIEKGATKFLHDAILVHTGFL